MFAAWTVMSCSTASEGVSLWRLRERKWTVRVERWEKRESRKRPERAGRWRGRRTSVALAAHWAFHAMNAPANACAVGEPVILLPPPSAFRRYFNRDGERVSAEWQPRRQLDTPPAQRCLSPSNGTAVEGRQNTLPAGPEKGFRQQQHLDKNVMPADERH